MTFPAPLTAPPSWTGFGYDAPADATAAARLLCSGQAHATVAGAEVPQGFAEEFRRRLCGEECHVVVTVPNNLTPPLLACLLSVWMGLEPGQMHDDIGGTVSQVVSGAGHRHDQSWHTDSSAWTEPNRYSVLALLAGTPSPADSTDLLPLAVVRDALGSNSAAHRALTDEPIAWRRNFSDLPALAAPIFGKAAPRWVWPVVEEEVGRGSAALRRGANLVARLINELPFHKPTVTPSSVLVFDNHRALHRAPHLERDAGRELIRIKVTGIAVP